MVGDHPYFRSLTASQAPTDCKDEEVPSAAGKLSGTNQKFHPRKNMPTSFLEKWLIPDLGQGQYKLSLEKQDVLLCHKGRKCSKKEAGMSKEHSLKGSYWPNPR